MENLVTTVSTGFTFNHPQNFRDVRLLGECQAGVRTLAQLLGWDKELAELIERESKIVLENAPNKKVQSTTPATSTTSATVPESTSSTTTTTASNPTIPESTNPNPNPTTTVPESTNPNPTTTNPTIPESSGSNVVTTAGKGEEQKVEEAEKGPVTNDQAASGQTTSGQTTSGHVTTTAESKPSTTA